MTHFTHFTVVSEDKSVLHWSTPVLTANMTGRWCGRLIKLSWGEEINISKHQPLFSNLKMKLRWLRQGVVFFRLFSIVSWNVLLLECSLITLSDSFTDNARTLLTSYTIQLVKYPRLPSVKSSNKAFLFTFIYSSHTGIFWTNNWPAPSW